MSRRLGRYKIMTMTKETSYRDFVESSAWACNAFAFVVTLVLFFTTALSSTDNKGRWGYVAAVAVMAMVYLLALFVASSACALYYHYVLRRSEKKGPTVVAADPADRDVQARRL